MLKLAQNFLRSYPIFCGFLTKIIYYGSNISFGKNLQCDSIPKILIDKSANLTIGDNVLLRRNVEIRIHGNSKIKIGNSCRIDRGVRLLSTNSSEICLDDGVRIGLYSVFNGGDSIFVGKKSLISGFVYLQTSNHGYRSKELAVQDQGYNHSAISIEEDVWIGTHVVIMPGILIQKGAVVGSNAVVNRDVNSFDVVAGIPARKIKERE